MRAVIFSICISISLCIGEVIENNPCDEGRDANILGETAEISVDPCPEAAEDEPCNIYRGHNSTITIRFTPSIEPAKLKSSISWVKGSTELSFPGMRPDACTYISCPVRANEETIFRSTMFMSKSLPVGLYPLKVKLQELRGRKRVIACQLLTIKLTDAPEEPLTTSAPTAATVNSGSNENGDDIEDIFSLSRLRRLSSAIMEILASL